MTELKESIPRYIVKESDFYCPISHYIMWHHGLSFKECPLIPSERNMNSCEKCKNRGSSSKNIKKEYKKKIVKTEKRKKESIPKIGKTYTSK